MTEKRFPFGEPVRALRQEDRSWADDFAPNLPLG